MTNSSSIYDLVPNLKSFENLCEDVSSSEDGIEERCSQASNCDRAESLFMEFNYGLEKVQAKRILFCSNLLDFDFEAFSLLAFNFSTCPGYYVNQISMALSICSIQELL